MSMNLTAEEREKMLEAIAPARERAFKNLSRMKKQRIDHRTVKLVER